MPRSTPTPASLAATSLSLIKRHGLLLSVSGVLLLAYTLLGTFLVPHLVDRYAADYVRDQLHRQLKLGKVQFNPFTLTLRIQGAEFAEQDGAPIARFEQLLVNAELSSLLTGSYSFKRIQLDAPNLYVLIDAQGKLNLDFSDPNAPAPDSRQPLPAVRIGQFQLRNGLVHLEDRSRPHPFVTELQPIQFTLSDFRTEPEHDTAFHFSGASEAGERFDWQGDFTVQPLGSTGKLQIAGLKADTVQRYLQDALPMRLLAGDISLQGTYQLSMNDKLALQLDLPEIGVKAMQVAPKQGDTPWVSLSTLQLAGMRVSLEQRNIAIQRIRIDGLDLNAWLDEERRLNLLQLMESGESGDAPWTSSVNDLELVNARVRLEDRGVTPAAPFLLFPVHLQVRNFSTAPHSAIDLDTRLRVDDRADIDAAGTVDLDTLGAQLKLKLGNFALKDVQPYIAQSTDMILGDGTLNAEGEVSYKGRSKDKAESNNPQIKFAGNIDIADLSTQDKLENKDFIKWQSLQLKNLSYSMEPDALTISEVIARQPYGRVIINSDGTTNVQHILRIQPKAQTDKQNDNKNTSVAKAAPKAPTMRTRIAKVVVIDGSANFTDNSVQPTFSTGMQRLNGTVTNLSSANDSRATIKLDGSVDNYAPVSITGEANFLAADTYSDVAMNFRNMELTTFNPYSGKFAGYNITKGKLSTELHYQIQNRQLNAQHHIVLDQLEFGDATDSKDAVPLPVKFAVALLKDRNGVIDLELPISGSLDDPQFEVGPIVWKAFKGLLTKVVTAPFAALGSLFGGSGEELAYVDFTPGSSDLSAVAADKLVTLAKAMVERPQLKLNVPLSVVTAADTAAMNAAAFDRALNAILPNATSSTPSQHLTALTTLYQRKLGSQPTFPVPSDPAMDVTAARIAYLESQLKPQFVAGNEDRDALARARADAVQAALLANTELSPERVFLTSRGNEVESTTGVVRMQLKLE